MLTYMRKRSKSWITKFIFGAIIIVFVFWGGSAYWSREASMVAKVDRYIITQQQFARAYSKTLELYQARLGDALTPEVLKKLDLKNVVMDQIINEHILREEAQKLGARVSDEDLQESIRLYPAFQQDGAFSIDLYKRQLQYQRMTPAEFEDRQRNALLQERVFSLVTGGVVVSPQEVESFYRYQGDTFDLNYLAIESKPYAGEVSVSDEEAMTFFEANKESYKVPPKITLTAMEFSAKDYLDQVEINEDEVREYYDSHQGEFTEDGKVTPFEKVSGPLTERMKLMQARNLARDDASVTYMELYEKGVFDLEEYAGTRGHKTRQIGPVDQGGETGVPEGEKMLDQAFLLPEGEIGTVVDTEDGSLIYMVKEKIPARIPEFAEVKDRVLEDMRLQLSLEKARKHAEDLAGKDARALEAMSPSNTGEFRRTDFTIPRLGMILGLRDDLDGLEHPRVYTHGGTVYLVWLKEKKKADIAEADEQLIDRIRDQLLFRKQEMAVQAFLEEARKRYDIVIDWAKLT